MEKTFKITYGGWYQRTTLHLSEIYDLFALGSSRLWLDKEKLTKIKESLNLEEVSRETGYLEFVRAKTTDGIAIRYYEDGLYVLETETDEIQTGQKRLEDYFNTILGPAISYIFSLGAPTPKELANIAIEHPTVVSVVMDEPATFAVDEKNFGKVYGKIFSEEVAVYKTPFCIFVVASSAFSGSLDGLVENLIFFREFKDQLERYLNIHRKVWEEISEIKEKRTISGKEVENVRGKLDEYQKTIALISNRINQMGSYIRTRRQIAEELETEKYLVSLFQFKFATLVDTLDYIKEIWKMTGDYLASAIQNLVEIKSQGTNRSIQSLQVITSIGVIAGIIGYLAKSELPKITAVGAWYFFLIITVTWLLNFFIGKIYQRKKYRLRFGERSKDI